MTSFGKIIFEADTGTFHVFKPEGWEQIEPHEVLEMVESHPDDSYRKDTENSNG